MPPSRRCCRTCRSTAGPRRALRMALADIGVPPDDAELLFPGGAADMIEAFCDWADRRMEAEAADARPGAGAHARTGARRARAAASRRTAPTRRRSAARWRVLALPRQRARLRPHAPRAPSMRSGTRRATVRPISAGTPSARSSARSMRRRCCTGCATAARTTPRRWPSSTGGWPASAASARCAGAPRRRSHGCARRDARDFFHDRAIRQIHPP